MADIDRSDPTPSEAAPEAADAAPGVEPAAPAAPEAADAAPGAAPEVAHVAAPEAPETVPSDVAAFFAGMPLGVEVYLVATAALSVLGRYEVRVTSSQVAFRRRRGFAWLWRPGRWLRNPTAEVVLSFALREPIESARLKQVVQASPRAWMHHLEVRDAADLDATVVGWLRHAFEEAE